MYIKFPTKSEANQNNGSSYKLANYLEKENEQRHILGKEYFFNHDQNKISKYKVVQKIDRNKKGLGKDEIKFYSFTINPSEKELKIISDKDLKEYTKKVMDEYAKEFKREGVNSGKDLVYFAKLEYTRNFKGFDAEVKNGMAKSGELKPGDNRHVHVIVSRKDKTQKYRMSPLANEKGNKKGILNGKEVQKGFHRSAFKQVSEEKFDQMFNYERSLKETYEYSRVMQKGTKEERLQMKKSEYDLGIKQKVEIKQEIPKQVIKQERSRNFGLGRG